MFSKSNDFSNTNNDEKELIAQQNELISNLNSELLTLDKQNKTMIDKNKDKKCDLTSLNENLIHLSYIRISKRFPHLNLQEIIDFEKIVRENGGSIETHSGLFILTERRIGTMGDKSYTHSTYNSWTCCWNAYQSDDNYQWKTWYMPPPTEKNKNINSNHISERFATYDYNPQPPTENFEKHQVCVKNSQETSTNLKNPRPELKCDRPEIFYLNEEDEEHEKIQKVNISEINSVINNNIDVSKILIENYSEMENYYFI